MKRHHLKKNLQIYIIQGKESALSELYRAYAADVYHLAFRLLKDTGWSEDIVQDVFVRFWNNRSSLRPDAPVWPLLYTLTKRASLNKLRSIRRSKMAVDQLFHLIQHTASGPDQSLLNKELAHKLETCFSELPPQQVRVMVLRKIEGLSYKEISKELKISPHTVRNHLVQAVKAVKKSYQSGEYLSIILFLSLLTAFQ